MKLELFLVSESASLRETLARIDANHHGVALMTDAQEGVVGLATDGDIRRMLLNGASLDDPISSCANRRFLWADQATPRENLLKQLDHRIRVIPVLDVRRGLGRDARLLSRTVACTHQLRGRRFRLDALLRERLWGSHKRYYFVVQPRYIAGPSRRANFRPFS